MMLIEMKRIVLILPLLALTACDDGPTETETLAQCRLGDSLPSDDDYMKTCMQAKGFLLDTSLSTCDKQEYPQHDVACYRCDRWFARSCKTPNSN
jgi:hypothetical protein